MDMVAECIETFTVSHPARSGLAKGHTPMGRMYGPQGPHRLQDFGSHRSGAHIRAPFTCLASRAARGVSQHQEAPAHAPTP